MFKDNKYTKWYFSIIENRRNNPIENEYNEKHHVIPRSMGGSNRKDNLVGLQAKEHFICHMLLVKMTSGRDKAKMSYALRMMMKENEHHKRHKLTAGAYERIKKMTKDAISKKITGKGNPFYGKKHDEQTKRKMRELRQERLKNGSKEGNRKPHSEETKEKLRQAAKLQWKNGNVNASACFKKGRIPWNRKEVCNDDAI